MDGLSVRRATEADIPALSALDPWPSETAWQGRIRDDCVLVLAGGPSVAGFLRWVALWTTVPFLELIEIAPSSRGRGGFRLLLEALYEDLRARGFVALLSSAQTDAPEALAWHRHMSFRPAGLLEDIADDGVGEQVFRILL